MSRVFLFAFVVLVAAMRLLAQSLPAANPYTSTADLAEGKRIFAARCGACHGQAGDGGRGPALNTGTFRSGSGDRELFLTIRNGVPNTEMPGSNQTDPDIWRVAAFVKQLALEGGKTATGSGEARAGQAVYASQGCAKCHAIEGEGGDLGPDLSRAGMRAARYLRDSVVNPSADVAFAYLAVSVTTAAGSKIRGVFLNEDDYSIQLRDMSGNPRSFLKSDLKDFQHDKESLMPSYASLSPADLENLVAYLSSLKGR